ncbi:MAG TPA: oxygenase MpaB family protein [Candidatus Limnocylindrales bacterium]
MARRPAPKRPLTTAADLAGLYGPGSEGWRLNREAALLLGAGPFALLLQVAHPLVAEGVGQHSNFRLDPWGRLAGTLRSYLRIVYGTVPAARAEIARLDTLHRRVTGPVNDEAAAARHGATYRARDPELALWVHATLIHGILVVTDRWQAPLAPDARARFYSETRPVGRLLGVPDEVLPRDIDAFDGYVDRMLSPHGPVHPSDASRVIARTILRPPLAGVVRAEVAGRLGDCAPIARQALTLVPQAAVDVLMLPAVGLLPAATRAEYGLPWGPWERAMDAWLVTGWRFWIPRLPPSFRWFPQALAADARMARAR